MRRYMLDSNVLTTCVHYLCMFLFLFNSKFKKIFAFSKNIYKAPELGKARLLRRLNVMSNLSFTCHPNVSIALSEATVFRRFTSSPNYSRHCSPSHLTEPPVHWSGHWQPSIEVNAGEKDIVESKMVITWPAMVMIKWSKRNKRKQKLDWLCRHSCSAAAERL